MHETIQKNDSLETGKARRTELGTASEEEGLREVVAQYGPIVLGVATRILRDASLAEDVAQDTFVAFWRTRERLDLQRGSIGALLCAIARNKAIDLVRKEESQRRLLAAEAAVFEPVAPDDFSEVDDRDLLRDALAELSAPQRQAIELAYFGGRTYREVGRELGIPEGTAKTRLRDGLWALRSALAPNLST